MLVLLPQYQKEELLGSLLILHFLYLVLPLALALVMLGLREVRAGGGRHRHHVRAPCPSHAEQRGAAPDAPITPASLRHSVGSTSFNPT